MGLTTIQVADKPTSDRIESKVDVISTNIGSTPLPTLISQGNKIISNNIANSSSYSIQIPYTSNIAMGDLVRYNETTDTVYASTYMSSTGIVSNITKQPANGQATEYLKVIPNPYCNGIYFGICQNYDTYEIFVDVINVNTYVIKTYSLGVIDEHKALAVKCFFNIENTMALYIKYSSFRSGSITYSYGSLTLIDVSSPEELIVHVTHHERWGETTSIVPFDNKGFIIGSYYYSVSDDLKVITKAASGMGFNMTNLNIYGTVYPNVTYYRLNMRDGYYNVCYTVTFDVNCVPTITEFASTDLAQSAYRQWGRANDNKYGNGYAIDNEWSIYNEQYLSNAGDRTGSPRMILAHSTPSDYSSYFYVKFAFKLGNSLYVHYGSANPSNKIDECKRFDIDYTKNTATENTDIPNYIAKYFNNSDFMLNHYLGDEYIFASTRNTASNTYNSVIQCFNYSDLDPILGVCNNIDNENKICAVALNGICNINTPSPVGTVLPNVGTYVTKNKVNLNQILESNASIIKSIQHISTMMPDDSTSDYNVTIDSVDISKSILLLRTSAINARVDSSTYKIVTPQISFKTRNEVRVFIFGLGSVYSSNNRVTTEFTVVEFM